MIEISKHKFRHLAAVKSEEEPKPNDIQPPLQKPKVIMQENKYEIIRNKACKTSKEKKITEVILLCISFKGKISMWILSKFQT